MPDDRLSGRTESVNPPEGQGRGEIPFVWVQDDTTGHRYDVAETAIGEGMTPVAGVELNWTGSARPPKYRTDKAGDEPSPAIAKTATSSGIDTTARKENVR